ncbi:MAG: hypothetical protein V4498_10160 [candidate division FCPU426 bacterium]
MKTHWRRASALALALLLGSIPQAVLADGFGVFEEKGVWWIRSPQGGKMLSLGVDCVGPGPKKADYSPAKPQYSAFFHNHDNFASWSRRSMARLDAWGFNTLGGWSDPGLLKSGKAMTPVLHMQASMGGIWWDLWGSDYPGQAKRLAERTTAPWRGNPGVLGYFLDNELTWADDYLLNLAMAWDAKAPGKKKLVEVFKKSYQGDFKKFSADFDTRARDWDSLLAITDTARRDGHGHRVMDAWVYEVSRRYYEVCAAAVRAADPGKLILGDRYQQYYPQAVARAARGLVDVVSVNYESPSPDGWVSRNFFETLHELSGAPLLVGEFYCAAGQNRSGLKNTGGAFTKVDTQLQRTVAVGAQVREFAFMPFVVGWHWFQFYDEPSYGRDDGEDYNHGLVDIYDQPYAEITAAFADLNAAAPGWHASSAPAPSAKVQAGPLLVALGAGLKADGDLGDWDKSVPLPRALIKTPAGLSPYGDFWLAWEEGSLWIAMRASGFNHPSRDLPKQDDEKTWRELHRLQVKATGAKTYEYYGATGVRADPKGDESIGGKRVLFLRPPQRGEIQASASTHLSKWVTDWELAIPAAALGFEKFKVGQVLRVRLDFKSRGDFETMAWKGAQGIEIKLAP